MPKKIILVDANSLIHRAFHALPPFRSPQGELVNAVYGFYSILLNIITRVKPDYAAISFDVAKKTFRHKAFEGYKAKRVKAPDELYEQFGRIKEILGILDFPIFEKEGFEADDVLATLSTTLKNEEDLEVYVVTSDKDAFQLINEKTFVLSPRKGGSDNIIYDDEGVKEKLGIRPDQVIDYKALTGDPSDNIAGVPGVGDKTAQTLLNKYETLDGVYDHLDEITGALHDRLANNKEEAYFCQKLVQLVHDVPMDFDLEKAKFHLHDFERALPLFEQLAFRSLITRLKNLLPKKEEEPIQASLF
jgi:DNA polymerase I